MKRANRIGAALVAVVLLGLVAWWLAYVPYKPERLFRPLPAEAVEVSIHRDLPARWSELTANPIARSTIRSLGADPDEVAAFTADPDAEDLFLELAGREVALAYVPALGVEGRPAWVATSWIGGSSHKLRLLAPWLEVEGLERSATEDGRVLYTLGPEILEGDQRPVLALVEGMLICCLSSDPTAMGDVLDCYDGLRPSIATAFGESDRVRRLVESAAPDRGWLLPGAFFPESAVLPGEPVFFEFEALTEDRIKGSAWTDAWRRDGGAGAGVGPAGGQVTDMLRAAPPLAVVGLDGSFLREAIARLDEPSASIAEEAVASLQPGVVGAALVGGEYSGRFKGIRIPMLLLGMESSDRDAALRAVFDALDRINARYGTSFAPRVFGNDASAIFRIDASDGVYSRLSGDERFGFAFVDGWLLIGSHFGSLQRLIASGPSDGDAAALAGMPTWEAGVLATGWVDLEKGAQMARLALSAYSLKLMFERGDGVEAAMAQVNEAKAWVESLSTLSEGRLSLRETGGGSELEFDFGP